MRNIKLITSGEDVYLHRLTVLGLQNAAVPTVSVPILLANATILSSSLTGSLYFFNLCPLCVPLLACRPSFLALLLVPLLPDSLRIATSLCYSRYFPSHHAILFSVSCQFVSCFPDGLIHILSISMC